MINYYLKKYFVGRIRSILILIIILVFYSGTLIKGQDIQFTQFDFNPILLNPANTGNFIGDWRVAGNYRNQWSGTNNPFKTFTFGADMPVYIMGRKVGVGVLVMNDVSGAVKLTQNKVYLGAGYGFNSNSNYFNVGLQAGMAFGSTGTWNKFNDRTGIWDLPSGEPDAIGNSSYFDINLGGSWKRSIHIFEPVVGVNMRHINMPKKTFTNGSDNVPLGMSIYATAKTKINDKIYATPKLYYSGQQSSSLIIAGSEGGYNLLGNRSSVKRIFGGVYIRHLLSNFDAFTVQGGATVGRFDIAVSYDMGISNLSQSNTMGSFEISFIYKSISTVLNSYSIPCERY